MFWWMMFFAFLVPVFEVISRLVTAGKYGIVGFMNEYQGMNQIPLQVHLAVGTAILCYGIILSIWEKYSGKELYVNKLAFLPQNPQTVFLKMTVREDYAEVRRTMGYSKEQMAQKTEEIAATLHIEHLLDRHPYDLSGGEQQKAAIGKILLLQPKLLLLDEPTKGIDAWSKRQLGMLLKQLKQQGITIIMVTHDVEFAAEVSDRCGLFFDHEITSLDVPEEFFCNNNYYKTAANRISRKVFDNTITCEEVIALCRQNGKKTDTSVQMQERR